MEVKLLRISSFHFSQLETGVPLPFLGDIQHSGFTSENLISDTKWIKIKNQESSRYLHCVPLPKLEENTILVKEDVYYNISLHLKLDPLKSYQKVQVEILEEFFPEVAETVKVSPVLLCAELANKDEELLLRNFFSKPVFLCNDDIFSIPLSDSLLKSAAYQGVSEIYFKVISSAISPEEDVTKDGGSYVFKDVTDLFCLSSISSYIPPKSENLTDKISKIPPDLDPYVRQIIKIFTPFTKNPNLECPPFFILSEGDGSGKAETLELVAEIMGIHILSVNAYDLSNVNVAAAEAKLEYLLTKCLKIGPCILVVTDFELLGRDKMGHEDTRLVTSFLNEITSAFKKVSSFPLFFVGVTDGKTDGILPAIARAALHTIKFQTLTGDVALESLLWMVKANKLTIDDSNLQPLAKKLSGFVHDDLYLLLSHARRSMHLRASSFLSFEDFQNGLAIMDKAYSDVIGVAKVPDVTWDDIGGLEDVKEEIRLSLSMTSDGHMTSLRRSGLLFYGPPGTGKTLMAKAVATESNMSFLSVKGPELMNMYVGQSEKNVREVFERGREAAPCILFFDELDSLAPSRGKSGDGGGVTDRVVSQLLAEMDGLSSNRGLFVIAATNRPDLVDSALLRPGRFDKMFYLGPLINVDEKLRVLQALTNKFKLSTDVDLREIAEMIGDHVTGADLYSVCSNAWLSSARRQVTSVPKGKHKGQVKVPLEVFKEDFIWGIEAMVPSLSPKDLRYYNDLAAATSNR